MNPYARHTMSAADLVIWMQTHKSPPLIDVEDGQQITILAALPIPRRRVKITLQHGDHGNQDIELRDTVEVSFKANRYEPVSTR